jgi:hypothetical protein
VNQQGQEGGEDELETPGRTTLSAGNMKTLNLEGLREQQDLEGKLGERNNVIIFA